MHLNCARSCTIIGVSLSEPHTCRTAVQNPLYIIIYTYILWVVCVYVLRSYAGTLRRVHQAYILTPHEYYMILPTLAISAASGRTIRTSVQSRGFISAASGHTILRVH